MFSSSFHERRAEPDSWGSQGAVRLLFRGNMQSRLKQFGTLGAGICLLLIFGSISCTRVFAPKERRDRLYYEIELIASAEQLKEFRNLLPEHRTRWLEDFWKRLDPTPGTPRNELRVLHDQRIEYARKHFPSKQSPSGWDDRGKVSIIRGLPHYVKYETVVVSSTPVTREIWYYFQRGLFCYVFNRQFFTHEFRLDSKQDLLSNFFERKNQSFWAEDESMLAESLIDAFERMRGKGIESEAGDTIWSGNKELQQWLKDYVTQEAMKRYYNYVQDLSIPVEGQLKLTMDIATFRSETDSCQLEISFGLPYDMLTVKEEEGKRGASVKRVLKIFDRNRTDIHSDSSAINFLFPADKNAREESYLVDVMKNTISSGEYIVLLFIQDENNPEGAEIYAAPFYAQEYARGSLALSNIQFASSVKPCIESGKFTKRGFEVIPYPSKVVRMSDDLKVYFEIYNLALKGIGRTLYRTEYVILPDDPAKGMVSLEVSDMGSSAETVKYLSLDLKDLSPGKYYLLILVTDETTEEKAIAATAFKLRR